MQKNEENDAKKYNSVRRAVKELKEQSPDQDNRKPMPPDELQTAPPKQPPISNRKSLLGDNIEDERFYESTDSTYDSIFLSKSMVERAEAMASAEIIAPPVEKKTVESYQEHPERRAKNRD